MNITLTGASGFIGSRLVRRLAADGHTLTVVGRSRKAGIRFFEWDAMSGEPPAESLENCDAVIHLAGEPVSQRWNHDVKRRIRESRTRGTRRLVQAISTMSKRPRVLVSASAVGYYGDRGEELLVESSAPGKGFLPEVCIEWEKEAQLAEALGMRVVRIRTGVALGAGGGALKTMLPVFRWGVGGKLGSGKQWVPWIDVDDLVDLMEFAVERDDVRGPLNGVAPAPVRNAEFTATLASVLHRHAVLPAPKFGVKLVFGEMADVVFASQNVVPKASIERGFQFRYLQLRASLEHAMQSRD